MQTNLRPDLINTPKGIEAERILRSCVHCGFCNATCPTYQLLGNEDDGPRGRIYLIKQMLEGAPATATTRTHLDRCLTCRNCETTCPAGVEYGKLVDIGRAEVEAQAPRAPLDRLYRRVVRFGLLSPRLFKLALSSAQRVRPLLPTALQSRIPAPRMPGELPTARHSRQMIVLEGCVQPALSPDINAAARRVFDAIGISLVAAPSAGCCGAIEQHMNAEEAAKTTMRRNIDAWWPLVAAGAEAIVVTASGCGVQIKDYGHVLAGDPAYARKAEKISALARDPIEILLNEQPDRLAALKPRHARRIAFHPPCTLQHGQKLKGKTEKMLAGLGFALTPVPDAHLCCGSAGTYSIFQPELSGQLKQQKVQALETGKPELIATANIGCQTHLESGTPLRVVHWLTLIDPAAPLAP
ncbi:glycolate oxidase subunit GlcF [Halothiobacillus sp.]|uniref:glycolate oxidase subunit GlcF n=1 Tax=Halothiobacillus sp. TaxID=1891311 RepID=UPI002AD556B7|nr:glycolate oxidase subunit GlcF [Halothiobacillus sp.]